MPTGDYPPQSNITGPESKEKINFRILMADDNKNARVLLEIMLGEKYTSVESVENGQELVEKFLDPDQRYDFIITDYIVFYIILHIIIKKFNIK